LLRQADASVPDSYALTCATPASSYASLGVALAAVPLDGASADEPVLLALPTAAAALLRVFALRDAAPRAGPAEGGTPLRLSGTGFRAADNLTCSFTHDRGACAPGRCCLRRACDATLRHAVTTTIVANVSAGGDADCATPPLPAGAVATVQVAPPAGCTPPAPFLFSFYTQPGVALSLPRAGPRHGPVTLLVYPAGGAFFARLLADAAPPAPPPRFACALTHNASGARVVLPAALSEDGLFVACATDAAAPLAAGDHDVSLSYNGVEFSGCASLLACLRHAQCQA
jgi:hypothetical protein